MTAPPLLADPISETTNSEKRLAASVTQSLGLRSDLERTTLRYAIACISQGVVISGPDRVILSVNQAFEKMTGYSEAEVKGLNCAFLQGPETNQKSIEELRVGLNAQVPVNVELLNYRKDG